MKYIILILALVSLTNGSNYSYPRMVIMGPTGVGKSSLGNVLAGCLPNDADCFFPVCPGGQSCTTETAIAQTAYLGNGPNVTLVDTPGFGDSGGDQSSLINEMITTLKDTLEEANITILCLDYDNRFDQGIQKMILELEALFGRDRFWDNVIIEVTKWAYDERSIYMREQQGYNETTALRDINNNLQSLFHLDFDLQGVFIDSYAVLFPEDQLQQSYFTKYTEELWLFAQSKTAFTFMTIEDVLEAFQVCQKEMDCLNGILDGRLTDIEADMTNLRIDLQHTNEQVEANKVLTDENINVINTRLDGNDVTITSNEQRITQNEMTISDHERRIGQNEAIISTHEQRLGEHDSLIASHDQKILQFEADIASNRDKIGQVEASVQTLSLSMSDSLLRFDVETHRSGYVNPSETVGYSYEHADTHNAMDNGGGTFIAPFSGTYGFIFYSTIKCTYDDSNNGQIYVYHNGSPILIYFCTLELTDSGSDYVWNSDSTYFSLNMNQGDSAKIVLGGGTTLRLEKTSARFTGFLLRKY